VTSPTEYKVTARVAATGDPAVADTGTTNLDIDTTWGGKPGLPGPAELLATASAACLLKNLARTQDLMAFDYQDADVEVIARRQESPPKFVEITYTLRITTDEPQRRVDLVHRNLRQFGTIYNTLAAVCEVHGELVAVPSAQPSTGL
jgi:uncharacterized OsmC-like protein